MVKKNNTIESGKDHIFNKLKWLGKKMQGKGKLVVSGANKQTSNPVKMMASKMATKVLSDPSSPKKFAADVNTSKDFNDLDKYLLDDNMTKRRFGGANKNNTKNSTIKYDKNEDSVFNSEDVSAAKFEETKKRRQSFKIKGKKC